MAESFLFNIAERVLEKIALLAVEEVRLACNVESDLRKLQETMSIIKAELLDAERQQHQNEKLRLCIWKLRDVFYDAEDVLDEFECDALQKEVSKRPSTGIKIKGCLSVNLLMEPAEEEDQDLHLNLKTFSVFKSQLSNELPRLLLEGSASTLQCIRLGSCGALERLPEWLQNLTSLQKLEISNCPELSSLPEGMHRLTALTQLKIEGCPMLTERCQRDVGADWPKIARVQEVDIKD